MEHHHTFCFLLSHVFDNHLPGQWVGYRGPTKLPKSPDKTLCNFFVALGQREVYLSKSRTPDEIKQEIQDNFSAVPLDLLRKSVEYVSSRLQKCVQNTGVYSELMQNGCVWVLN
jgi:hypothetical protein